MMFPESGIMGTGKVKAAHFLCLAIQRDFQRPSPQSRCSGGMSFLGLLPVTKYDHQERASSLRLFNLSKVLSLAFLCCV